MFNYNSRCVNILSLVISIIIFFCVNNTTIFLQNKNLNSNIIFSILKKNEILVEMNSIDINQDTEEKISNINRESNNSPLNLSEEKKWKIIIPKISLNAQISEGTNKEIMDQFVGHFEETSLESGNVGLAAHNRGYKVNYFSDLKKLQEGDEILYIHDGFNKTYVVDKHIIIKDIDWSYLQNSEKNIITLITCVENEPEYRRCIQGIEKE